MHLRTNIQIQWALVLRYLESLWHRSQCLFRTMCHWEQRTVHLLMNWHEEHLHPSPSQRLSMVITRQNRIRCRCRHHKEPLWMTGFEHWMMVLMNAVQSMLNSRNWRTMGVQATSQAHSDSSLVLLLNFQRMVLKRLSRFQCLLQRTVRLLSGVPQCLTIECGHLMKRDQ